ncbi:MAG: Gfo/Idh/MocA family oxidoreductase, partial [Planctomycetaceae bacterium]|nr:Gfo/Idh/MocA family oxidoreductase [Planctomycetaceae bacterium]
MNSITPVNGLVAGVTIMGGAASAQGTVANNKVNISIVGCGNRCKEILDGFKKRDDVNIVSCCDPRKQRREQLAAMTGGDPVEDMRTVLDDKRVDAIFAPLPDHWHALAVFWACKAGKDIYVEKPLTHDPFEGVQCVKAARKYKRIVQHGTQNLSAPYNIEAKKYIKDGKLGDIHLIRVFDMQSGGGLNIKKGEKVPDGFNYDYWLGPVPDVPYSSSIVNHGWHSLWDFSAGDMADDGIHQLDLARWLIDKDYPNSAYSAGGRFNNISD